MNFTLKSLLSFFAFGVFLSCNAQFENFHLRGLQVGAVNYDEYLPLLENKKVGVLTNQTGVFDIVTFAGYYSIHRTHGKAIKTDTTHYHLVDFLIENNINLQKIYAPEHGFRGTADAGELIKDGRSEERRVG